MSINNKILIILYKGGAGKNFLVGAGAPASPLASATVAEERKTFMVAYYRRSGGCRWSWQSLVVLIAQGGAGGRNGDGAGFLWRRKKEEENLQRGEGGRLVFSLTLDPLFSSLKSPIKPIFIGGGRGQSRLHRGKISALDSVGKDLIRWLKVGMVHCQICRKSCLSWHV